MYLLTPAASNNIIEIKYLKKMNFQSVICQLSFFGLEYNNGSLQSEF